MENYIVRVYRREEGDPEAVVGVLENVETRQRQVFHSLPGLCGMLACHPPCAAPAPPDGTQPSAPHAPEPLADAGTGRSR